MEYNRRCVKFDLPDGCTLDVLDSFIESISQWRQIVNSSPESGGLILGYENCITHNITLTIITEPSKSDVRCRFFCKIRDRAHFDKVKRNVSKMNFYLGSWHTHPQDVPEPSSVDWREWNSTLRRDVTASKYVVFIIAGIREFRVWVGNRRTGIIEEIYESKIVGGIYIAGGTQNED